VQPLLAISTSCQNKKFSHIRGKIRFPSLGKCVVPCLETEFMMLVIMIMNHNLKVCNGNKNVKEVIVKMECCCCVKCNLSKK
jgi:hypothetical protein